MRRTLPVSLFRSAAVLAALSLLISQVPTQATPVVARDAEDEKQWNETVDKAIAFLRKSQAEDGSFSKSLSVGVTGVVVTGLLGTGKVDVNDPMMKKALAFLVAQVDTQEGHIAGPGAPQRLRNYVTAVNVLALAAANKQNGQYAKEVAMAAKFLKGLQWDEAAGAPRDNPQHGGFGYDVKQRPDLSNTQYTLEALNAAGIPADDPVMKKAQIFVSRSQNLKSEHQDQPWAAKTNDGSFVYNPAPNQRDMNPDGSIAGYGSITYAGIKSLIYAGVSKNDPRVKTALDWVRKNYTVDANPGQPAAKAQAGLFYYYHSMAKCMDTLGIDDFEDVKGVKHNWRRDLTQAMAKRQKPDGSWNNPQDRFMEGDQNLATGFALMALTYTKPKK